MAHYACRPESQNSSANLWTGRILSLRSKTTPLFQSVSHLHRCASFVSIRTGLLHPPLTFSASVSLLHFPLHQRPPPLPLTTSIITPSISISFTLLFSLIDMFPFSGTLSLHHLHSPSRSCFSSIPFLLHSTTLSFLLSSLCFFSSL